MQFVKSRQKMVTVLTVLIMAVVIVAPAAAQTPVPLNIPVNEIFTQTNSWMTTFAPVVAIGIGIAVALAILAFLGNQIIRAFRGSGAR
jgi:hypothetical protein